MPDIQPPLPEGVRADARAPIGRNRQFRLLFLCLLVIGAGNSMLLAVAPPLVRELRLADSSVGWIFSLSALLWVFASPIWGRLSDRVGRKPVAALGLGAYAVSMAAFGVVVMLGQTGLITGLWLFTWLMLARAIFGAFGSASSPAAQAYIADRTTRFERTEQLAGLTAAFALGQAFGPAVCAALAAKFGLVFPIWLVAALAAAASFAIWANPIISQRRCCSLPRTIPRMCRARNCSSMAAPRPLRAVRRSIGGEADLRH
jgi:MFS family permease